MPPLTLYEIARLIIQIGWPAAKDIIDTIQGDSPDWVKLKAKVQVPFEDLAGPRPTV